jgi:steroid delta-isomerase-like uncharacterized protein
MMRLSSWTVLLIIPLIVSCGPSTSDQLDANKEIVRQFAASINAQDWNTLEELITEDFHRYCQATPEIEIKTSQEFMELQKSFLASIPDQKVTLEMLIAEGEKVAVYATYSGTQTGPMGNLPATGKHFESKYLGIFRIVNGQISELWVEWDNLAILTQLGLFPPPADVVN